MKDRIRQVMNYAGMSQQDFANRLDISAASLSSIFTGRTNPTNNHVNAIHKEFPEINVNWLMFGEGSMLNENADTISNDALENTQDFPAASEAVSNGSPIPIPSLFDPQTPAASPSNVDDYRRLSYRGRPQNAPTPHIMSENVVSAINIDKERRKIREIRVFFSDGTYESFVPSTKS